MVTKRLIIIVLAVILLVSVYIRVFIPGNMQPYIEIEGDTENIFTVVDNSGKPAAKAKLLFVLHQKPGEDSATLSRFTDEKGVAKVFLRPGSFTLKYDDSVFNFETKRGEIYEKTVILKTNN